MALTPDRRIPGGTDRTGVRSIALALLAACLALPTQAAPTDYAPVIVGVGLPITALEIRSDVAARDVGQARELLQLEIGQVLTYEAVRRALLSVHGSGVVSQAEVHTRLSGGGVDVLLVIWSNVLVESVGFVGETSLGGQDLEDLVEVRPDRPLVESQVMRSVFDLQDRFAERGFLEQTVRPDVQLDASAKRASVVFRVDAGPRASVASIEFDGDLGPIDPVELRKSMRSKVGERYRSQRAREDSDALQKYLFGRGYRMAGVSRPTESYDATSDSMALTYAVELGPLIEVEVLGAELAALRRRGLLPFLGAQGYDPALVGYSVKRVRSWYQSKGHYDVTVDAAERVEDDHIALTLTIDPGPVFQLGRIVLEGNEAFDDKTLGALIDTSERRLFEPASGRLVDAVVIGDMRSLQSYYRLQGFHEAKVGPHRVERRAGALDLVIPIDEGDRLLVETVDWQGALAIDESRLAERLPIRPGGPFHVNLVEQAVGAIRAQYRDEGFHNVLVSSVVSWDDTGHRADVTLYILEGPRTVVRRVVVRGQQHTNPWVLRRAIGLEAGDPVSPGRLFEIRRNLYRLGIFEQVEVDLTQGSLLAAERDVVVRVEEGDRHRLSFGAGYDSEDGFRGLFGYSRGNLLGRGHSLHLDTVVSQREELYRLLVRQPSLGNWRFPVVYSIFNSREEETAFERGFDGNFVVEQSGLQIEGNARFDTFRVPIIYTLKNVDNNAPPDVSGVLFDREKAKVRISSLTTGLLLDRRDSLINPTDGRNTVLQLEYAFEAFGADESFLKLFAQRSHYVNLRSAGVVSASLRLGGIESFRDPVEAVEGPEDDCRSDPIPDFGVAISERFFAGGRSTHRAYDLDSLGVPGQTLFVGRSEQDGGCVDTGLFPTGGNGLALFNLEYRYPFGPGFWATAFYDTGNVWADWRDIDLSESKDGLGVGVGWDSPVGPLRLEIGWKLDREIGEDPYKVFLSFGAAF